jgi:hypothetical protein
LIEIREDPGYDDTLAMTMATENAATYGGWAGRLCRRPR